MHLPLDDNGRSNRAAPDPERDRPRRRVARHRGTVTVMSNTPSLFRILKLRPRSLKTLFFTLVPAIAPHYFAT